MTHPPADPVRESERRHRNHSAPPVVSPVVKRTAIAATATAVALACLSGTATAQRSGGTTETLSAAPAWSLVRVNTFPRDDVLNDLAVTRAGVVWAIGHRTVNKTQRGLVQRYDGRSWKTVPGSPPYALRAVVATSARDAWVFGPDKAARWNGNSWSSHSLGRGFVPADADGTGPRDIWAVSPAAGFRHWDGATWKRVRTPGGAKAVDAYRPGEAWAVGSRDLAPAVMRWDGASWTDVELPTLTLPSPDAAAELNDVAVLSPSDVWAVGDVSWEGANQNGDDVTFSRTLLLHWDGSAWTATVGTANGQSYAQVEPDGSGGVWIAQSHWNSTLWHVVGGNWTSTPVPRRTGMDAALYSIVRRPGGTTLWGAGFLAPQGDPDDPSSNGAFWRLG
jgi:hypothetical protein